MGIFDPVRTLNPDDPIDTVGQYQRAMNRATYSPAVAQAAARSGINPTMATRIASREVASQAAQALPGLIQNDVQMMEARRQENERKERERLALMLNTGGQVLGMGLQALGGTNLAQRPQAGSPIGGTLGTSVGGSAARGAIAPAPAMQAAAVPSDGQLVAQQTVAPSASATVQPMPTDQPIYTTPAQTPGAPVISAGLLAAQPVQSPIANQYLQDAASAELTPPNTGRRIRRRR